MNHRNEQTLLYIPIFHCNGGRVFIFPVWLSLKRISSRSWGSRKNIDEHTSRVAESEMNNKNIYREVINMPPPLRSLEFFISLPNTHTQTHSPPQFNILPFVRGMKSHCCMVDDHDDDALQKCELLYVDSALLNSFCSSSFQPVSTIRRTQSFSKGSGWTGWIEHGKARHGGTAFIVRME